MKCSIMLHFIRSTLFARIETNFWGLTMIKTTVNLDGIERACCFALFVFLVSRGCCVALPRGTMYLSAVCNSGIF